MADFEIAVNYVLKNEKGLEENKNDPGGITNFGISLRFLKSLPIESLRKYGLLVGEIIDEDDIKQLTIEQAKAIYHGEFWCAAPFEGINNQHICDYIFDMAINMGLAPSIKCAQRATWTMTGKIDDDGILGKNTIEAINICELTLIFPLRAERASYYRLIVNNNPDLKEFLNGWLNRTYQ